MILFCSTFECYFAVPLLLHLQLNYREAYHKEKHLYTTVLDTCDYTRCLNLKQLYSTVSLKKTVWCSNDFVLVCAVGQRVCTRSSLLQKAYSALWDRIKAKSYSLPHDANALVHAKQQKALLSNVSTFLHSFNNIQNNLIKKMLWIYWMWFLTGEIQRRIRKVQVPLQPS